MTKFSIADWFVSRGDKTSLLSSIDLQRHEHSGLQPLIGQNCSAVFAINILLLVACQPVAGRSI